MSAGYGIHQNGFACFGMCEHLRGCRLILGVKRKQDYGVAQRLDDYLEIGRAEFIKSLARLRRVGEISLVQQPPVPKLWKQSDAEAVAEQ